MIVGPIANGVGIISGSFIGASLGRFLPEKMKERLPMIFGVISMSLGISMIMKVKTMPAVVLAVLLGTIIGEFLRLEDGIQHLAAKAKNGIEKIVSAPDHGLSHDEFMEKFVAMIVLFCASGLGIFGSLNEGISGDASLLIVKTFLDFFTAIIFATSLGISLAVVVVPQFLIQAILFFSASFIMPYTNEVMLMDFSAVGGIIMLATGFRICRIVPFAVANILPALFIIMPLSAFWARFIPS